MHAQSKGSHFQPTWQKETKMESATKTILVKDLSCGEDDSEVDLLVAEIGKVCGESE